jgi:hypothetical protein
VSDQPGRYTPTGVERSDYPIWDATDIYGKRRVIDGGDAARPSTVRRRRTTAAPTGSGTHGADRAPGV